MEKDKNRECCATCVRLEMCRMAMKDGSKCDNYISNIPGDIITGIGVPIKPQVVKLPQIGKKYDEGKPRLAEMIQDFRLPLIEVAKVWAFGADKYDKGNWRYVLGGEERYTNALMRHLVAEADTQKDDESELMHAAHVAWNALARLHFLIEKEKKDNGEKIG